MDDVQIKNIVRDFICEQFLPGEDPENLADDVKLLSEGILDSLGSLRLVAFLEERFGIKIEAHEVDVENLDTLTAITRMVKAKLG